jgi:structural maintenance of chromosome 2
METDLATAEGDMASARKHANKTAANLAELKETVKVQTDELKAVEAKIAEETKMLTAFKDELDALDVAIKAKRQEIADGEVKVGELEHKIEGLKKDRKACAEAVAKLERQFEWIADEHQ